MATDQQRIDSLEKEVKDLKERLSQYKDKIDEKEDVDRRSERTLTKLGDLANAISNVFKGINDWVGKSWGEADDAASKYSKTIATSARGMETLRKNTIDFVTNNSIGARFNTSMKELIQLQQTYNAQIGRAVTLTNMQLENMAAMRAVLGDEQTIKFTANFEKFGLDANAAADMFTDMFNESANKGIVLDKYSKNLLDNIDLAQRYTFQDGIDGLKRMAAQATSIKWDMQQTAAFAEKVNSVEGAIKTGARLSVLGGPFSSFSNPMGLLYESLNDMEGLQDRMVKMFGNLGRWDSAKQQMDISAYNRMRIRAASEAMGISYDKAIESINAQGRRREVNRQLGERRDLSEEVRELVLNSAQIDRKTGKAYVTINGRQKSLENVSNSDLKALQDVNKSQAQDVKDIAQMLRSYTDTVQGREKQLQAVTAQFQEGSGIGKLVKTTNTLIGESNAMLRTIMILMSTGMFMKSFGNLFKSIRGLRGGGSTTSPSSVASGRNGGGPSSNGGYIPTGGGQVQLGPPKGANINGRMDYYKSQQAIKDLQWARANRGKPEAEAFLRQHHNKIKQFNQGFKPGNSNITPGKSGAWKGAVSTGLGIAGVASTIGGSIAYAHGKENLGNYLSYAGMGASMGAALGPWGAIGGAVIGAGIAFTKQEQEKRKNQLLEELHRRGIELLGDYKPRELEAISKGQMAVNTISGLRDKMKKQGDMSVYESLQLSKGGLILGPSHANGGVSVGRSNIEVEGGEFVVNKDSTQRHLGTLTAINQDNIKPIEPMGKQMKVSETYVNNTISDKIDVSPLKIDVGGSLKLDLGGQQGEIDGRQLLNNPEFVRHLTNVLTKEINIRENKRFDKQSYYKRF